MKKVKRLTNPIALFTFLPFYLFTSLPLSAMSIPEIQEKMSESSQKVESLSFSYIQELRSSLSPGVSRSSGTAVFQKPRNLRLEQTEPEPQMVISSGKTVFIYTPRFRQVIKNSWKGWLSQNLLFPGLTTFSDALKNLKREYEWQMDAAPSHQGEKQLCLRLSRNRLPKDHYLILCLETVDFIPVKTEWVAGTLSLTTTLLSLQVNPTLSPELFQFRVPAGTSVIELR